MAYRFTDTNKWSDNWFFELKPNEKLLFMYLCDNCDIAGFIEINFRKWSTDLNINNTTIIKGALKGLQRGLIYSLDNDVVYVKNFLKHQKNYPLNEKNKSHLGILRRFDLYLEKFNIQDVTEFIEGALKGLQRGTGIGIGNISIEDNNKYIYNKYYDNQIELSNNDKNYIKIVKILFGENNLKIKLNSVLKIENQLSYEQAKNILNYKSKFNINITSLFEEMENWKGLKDKKTVYRTFITFMKNRYKNIK